MEKGSQSVRTVVVVGGGVVVVGNSSITRDATRSIRTGLPAAPGPRAAAPACCHRAATTGFTTIIEFLVDGATTIDAGRCLRRRLSNDGVDVTATHPHRPLEERAHADEICNTRTTTRTSETPTAYHRRSPRSCAYPVHPIVSHHTTQLVQAQDHHRLALLLAHCKVCGCLINALPCSHSSRTVCCVSNRQMNATVERDPVGRCDGTLGLSTVLFLFKDTVEGIASSTTRREDRDVRMPQVSWLVERPQAGNLQTSAASNNSTLVT